MRIAVVGGCGFVGSSICSAIERMPAFELTVVTRENYRQSQGNGEWDILIHSAMPSKRFWARENQRLDFEETVVKSFRLLNEWRWRKFVLVSSVSARCQLDTVYGRHKAAAEKLCTFGDNLIVRLGPLYGDGLTKGVLVDMALDRTVYLAAESRHCFAPLDWVAQSITANFWRAGRIELGARDSLALADVARLTGSASTFDGPVDHQEMQECAAGAPPAIDVIGFAKALRQRLEGERCSPTRVLITGGSGFLGRAIVRSAIQQGYDVVAPRSSEFDLVTGRGLNEYMRRATQRGAIPIMIHSAAYYGGIAINAAEPAAIFNRNGRMTLHIFELAREFGIRKVIPIGSACSYPGYLHGVLREADFWSGPLHDSVEAYGFSKKVQLVGQNAYYKQFGIEGNHLVLANLYGPHDVFSEYRSHVMAALVKKFVGARDVITLWGDGSPVREFLYVDDAAEAIVRAIQLPHDLEPVNIGTGVGISIGDLASLMSRLTGFRGRVEWDSSKPNGCALKVLDTSRMFEKLHWNPPHSLEEGLRKTIEWYVANREVADQRF